MRKVRKVYTPVQKLDEILKSHFQIGLQTFRTFRTFRNLRNATVWCGTRMRLIAGPKSG